MATRNGSKPRVALVTYEVGGPKGVPRGTGELIRRGSAEVDFVVVSRTLSDDLRPLVRWRRAPAPGSPFKATLATFLLTGGLQLLRGGVDLVHVHAIGPTVLNRSDVTSLRFVRAGFYDSLGSPQGLGTRLHLWLERTCHGRARVLAALSAGARREAERFFPGARVVEIPNGVDSERFHPDEAARRDERAAAGAADDDVVVLFVGNAWSRKGLPESLEAFGRALERVPGLRLWVAGDGDPERYRHLAGDRVRFCGVRGDVERLYAAADIFLLPTLYETFCQAAYEAAAVGLPVVATPASGIEELIGDDEAGIVVDRDPQTIADALVRLAGDPDERRRLGETGRARALECTWERSVERTLEVYRELLAEKGR